jgi:hypothetical protein
VIVEGFLNDVFVPSAGLVHVVEYVEVVEDDGPRNDKIARHAQRRRPRRSKGGVRTGAGQKTEHPAAPRAE